MHIRRQSAVWVFLCLLGAFALAAAGAIDGGPRAARAQDAASDPVAEDAGPSGAPPAPVAEVDAAALPATAGASPRELPAPPEGRLSLFWLIFKGGWLMLPIGLMSFVVVLFSIERLLALRRSKVMPNELVEGLGQLAASPGGFDPRKAYRLCQKYPSATASIIRSMLLKVGRPHSEVEHAVAEASSREAGRLYANVRWLILAAAVTPLLGLLGTVWGMIQAFFNMTQLQPGQNKADFLAEGIYVALVTTLGGLAVAIPAAILAHFFEGRIQSLFHQVDELLFSLLPQIERYEGRLRVSRQSLGDADGEGKRPAEAAPPAENAPRTPAATPQ